VFGVLVDGDRVLDAAPIARWMIGERWARCEAWVKTKGGVIDPQRER
jgi:hypothetical protein